MKLELTLAGLLVKLANYYTNRGAQLQQISFVGQMIAGYKKNLINREAEVRTTLQVFFFFFFFLVGGLQGIQ